MDRQSEWSLRVTGRAAMRPPGRLPVHREVQRQFWEQVAQGLSSHEAAASCGVSGSVGSRLFRDGGGMPPMDLAAPCGRYLSFAEREEIALARARGAGVREIARDLGRAPSTVSRELRRNAAKRSRQAQYRALVAQWKAELVARRPKTAKLVGNPVLHAYVQERLAGQVRQKDGSMVAGPAVPAWAGGGKPRRRDRQWARSWSPEQISRRLLLDFPDDESMRISHEAIYQALCGLFLLEVGAGQSAADEEHA